MNDNTTPPLTALTAEVVKSLEENFEIIVAEQGEGCHLHSDWVRRIFATIRDLQQRLQAAEGERDESNSLVERYQDFVHKDSQRFKEMSDEIAMLQRDLATCREHATRLEGVLDALPKLIVDGLAESSRLIAHDVGYPDGLMEMDDDYAAEILRRIIARSALHTTDALQSQESGEQPAVRVCEVCGAEHRTGRYRNLCDTCCANFWEWQRAKESGE